MKELKSRLKCMYWDFNSFDPYMYQDQLIVGPELDTNYLTLHSIPENIFFAKKRILIKSADDKNCENLPTMQTVKD